MQSGGLDESFVLLPPAPAVAKRPFVFLESIVTNEATGERLSDSIVHRGSTRCERLLFEVNAPLVGLKRTVINYKQFPMVGYQKVGVDEVPMGDYFPTNESQSFELAKAKIPNLYLARGKYRIDLSYTAQSHPGEALLQIKHDFEVF